MKHIAVVAGIMIMLVIAGCMTRKPNATKGVVYINDVRGAATPGDNLLKYHDHDVDVFRTSDHGSSYRVYYYRKIADTLRCYQAIWGEPGDLDRAAYRWMNDSLVSIRLYSTTSKKEVKFRVFGNTRGGKKISGMMTAD